MIFLLRKIPDVFAANLNKLFWFIFGICMLCALPVLAFFFIGYITQVNGHMDSFVVILCSSIIISGALIFSLISALIIRVVTHYLTALMTVRYQR